MRDAKVGILIVNLGSPKSTDIQDVKKYLDEFLMDKRVIDYPWLFRALLVKGIILNTRPKHTAKAYQKIWTLEGSPLISATKKTKEKLQEILPYPVSIGMRYSEPSIENGIRELLQKGISHIIVLPLYPQYAMSTTQSVMEKVKELKENKFPTIEFSFINSFYNNKNYIRALSHKIQNELPENLDLLLFSYHGIPERHIYKTDPTHTCKLNNCCFENQKPSHPFCYKHQCFATTELVREKLNFPKEKTLISFQSRLGREQWLRPYTNEILEELPTKGIKNIAIVCPAFVSDCLETLEEIAIEGKNIFLNAGGESFTYISCLNEDPGWISTIKTMCEEKINETINSFSHNPRLFC